MKLTPVYAITGDDGAAELAIDGSLSQAVDIALSKFGKGIELVYSGDLSQAQVESPHRLSEQDRLPNPPLDHVAKAMRALGPAFWDGDRPRTFSRKEIESEYPMTPEGLRAAHAAIAPYFPKSGEFLRVIGKGPRAGQDLFTGATYEKPHTMSAAFLVSNAKTVKAVEGLDQIGEADPYDSDEDVKVTVNPSIPPSLSKGIAFLPHALSKNVDYFPHLGGVPQLAKQLGVCVGSSQACRKSCLIYAGQNQAVEHNNKIKGARLFSFLQQPEAFLRMVVDSLERHVKASEKKGVVPYFRPNILSDIPWEVLFPDLWSYDFTRRCSVYDYTKLGGRNTEYLGRVSGMGPLLDGSLRYDLTFSFSGRNAPLLESELDRGTRVAIVFLRKLKSGSLKPNKHGRVTYKAAESFHNLTFLGKKIIDGDFHDLRPLDPQGTVVGLRFKTLRNNRLSPIGNRAQQIRQAGDFVVGGERPLPGAASPHRASISPSGPSVKWVVEAFDDGHGNLIAAGTPSQEGVSLTTLYGPSK